MYKAIGFIACVSMMAASLYVFSGGDPSRTLSAQTESANAEDAALARQFMKDARESASRRNYVEARRLASVAATLTTDWRRDEQSPQQFLASLDRSSRSAAWSVVDDIDWASLEPDAVAEEGELRTPQEEPQIPDSPEDQPLVSRALAERFVHEALKALEDGDLALARTRAMQARKMKIAWRLWEKQPKDILAAIDQAEGTATFLADQRTDQAATSAEISQTRTQATGLLRQARAAMDANNVALAEQLTTQAEALNASYRLHDDTPAQVRRDIQRYAGAVQKIEPDAGAVPQFAPFDSEPESFEAPDFGSFSEASDAADNTEHSGKQFAAGFDESSDKAWELLEGAADKAPATADAADVNPFEQSSYTTAAANPAPPADEIPAVADNTTVSTTSFDSQTNVNMSAEEAWNAGLAALRAGDPVLAREAFLIARKNIGELDSFRRQQLKDQLRELSSVEGRGVRTIAALPDDIDAAAQEDQLTAAVEEHNARLQRMHTAVTNAVARAESYRDSDIDEGLQILENVLAEIEESELTEESAQALTSYVQQRQSDLEGYREQRAPMIEMEERNESVKRSMERSIKQQMRIEQEVADLVQQYNELNNQHRYAEAALVAQKAYDLNPHLPETVVILEKSRLAQQIAFNEDVRQRSAQENLNALNDVESTMAMRRGDYVLPEITKWQDISSRRAGYGSSGRKLTDSELHIQKALRSQVSLHFHDVPLTEIISHIANTHKINIVLDRKAIESQGLVADQTVSIDVDGIELRSALNLLLQQSGDGLVYTIADEVLKITDSLEQESYFIPRPYQVADLVVPLSSVPHPDPFKNVNGPPRDNGLYQLDDDIGVQIGPGGLPRSGSSTGDPRDGDANFSGLIDMITTAVAPGTWAIDGGEGTIGVSENTLSLVIRQTPAVHDQIVELLEQLRKLQDLQVTVEVRFIAVTDDFFERIGVDFDFNVPDSLGDPPGVPAFGSTNFALPGGAGGQAGGQAGGAAGAAGGAAGVGGIGGGVGGGGIGGAGGAGGAAGAAGGAAGQVGQAGNVLGGLFLPVPRSTFTQDGFRRTTVGLARPGQFTQDFDIQFQQGSFELGIPQFGNFDPTGGLSVGMAILSDLEAFFFLEAVQSDRRSNVLFAPKVTLFNGQDAILTDQTTRPYVSTLIPSVGTGAVGFTPVIGVIPDGIQLQVSAVISADRRYVRLSLAPNFTNLIELFTFTFAGGGAGGGAIGGGAGGGIGGGGIGGAGGGIGGGGIGGGGGGGALGFGGIGGGFGGGGGGIGGAGGAGGGIGGGGAAGGIGGAAGGGGAGAGDLTIQQPVIETISVSTTVSVPDGGTVLLGGIKRLREGRTMFGVPILNKIPYVSRLFKNSGVGRETESIMLMVTPRIIIQEEEEEVALGTSAQ